MTPVEIWNRYYPEVESISHEKETIDAIRLSKATRDVVIGHVASTSKILDKISSKVAEKYRPWAIEPDSYNFGSEAYYQSRVLATIGNLEATRFRISHDADVICARQVLTPSAFSGSPRIKRVSEVAFLIFPAPTVFWMYATFEMIAAFMGHGNFDRPKIGEYLTYVIATRTFRRWATEETAYAIDFLVDELVHRGSPRAESGIPGISPLSINLIGAAEHFIVCHEIAHFALGHPEEGDVEIEAAADRRAIEMLQAFDPAIFVHVECPGVDGEVVPLLGYLALRLWTNIRLAAEIKVLPYVFDTPEEITARRESINKVFADRVLQIQRTEILGAMSTAPILEKAVEAAHQVIQEILAYPIDINATHEMQRLAKTLASGEYNVLSNRLFSDARKRRMDHENAAVE